MKTFARNLIPGTTFTDHMNHTHAVHKVDLTAGGTGAGVYVHVEGQGYPEFYESGQVVTVQA